MKLWILPQEFDDYWVCIYVSFSLLICWMVNILYSPVFELYYFVICDFCLLLTINFSLIKEKTNILALCILMWVYYIANCNLEKLTSRLDVDVAYFGNQFGPSKGQIRVHVSCGHWLEPCGHYFEHDGHMTSWPIAPL